MRLDEVVHKGYRCTDEEELAIYDAVDCVEDAKSVPAEVVSVLLELLGIEHDPA